MLGISLVLLIGSCQLLGGQLWLNFRPPRPLTTGGQKEGFLLSSSGCDQ
ncbi:hypothetical protein I7I53_11846 [Histoplasma capsulatum var. duboisii H88]|nr:hypothetical protein I7I53_11846 [Histoplasma capsulatum var. duboisii H88]